LLLTARLARVDSTLLPALFLLGGLAAEMRYETRPELVSYLLLALVLYLLHRHAEGKASPLWLLVPIHLIWVNMHGLFIVGWLAEGCFILGLLVRDRRLDRRLLVWTAAAVTVALLNPYGWRGATFPLVLATRLQPENVFAQSIGEFTSPFAMGLSSQFPFYPRAPIFSFRLFALLSLLALIPLARRKRWWSLLLWGVGMALAYRMVRNIPVLIVATLPATVWGLSASRLFERLRGLPSTGAASRKTSRPESGSVSRRRRRRKDPARHLRSTSGLGNTPPWVTAIFLRGLPALVIVVALFLGLRVYHDAYYIASRRIDRFGLGWNRLSIPVDAVEYARRAGLRGPVLNHLNLGGWLMWAHPDPVFIDGRLEVMGEKFYNEYRRALSSTDELEATVARHGIRWLFFPYAISPQLLGRVSKDEHWELVYTDHLAAIFTRKDAGEASTLTPLLPALVGPAPPTASLPGLGGEPRPGRLQRQLSGLFRRAAFPGEDYYLGLFHLYRGEFPQAAARFSLALQASGGAYYEIYNNLGAVYFRMKRFTDARACYEMVLQDDPSNRIARERLSSLPAP
jgi:tetratricopeptide (TPR) repeat protein